MQIAVLVAGFPWNFEDVDRGRPDTPEKFREFVIAYDIPVLQSAVLHNALMTKHLFSEFVFLQLGPPLLLVQTVQK